jgi:peptidoglycan/xylan/chitin deacetylase (PgdA/CDA1 family)
MKGKFVISLDYELMWGVRDKKTIQSYGNNIANVSEVIDKLLECFENFEISATFATVGFLLFNSKKELLNNLPSIKPTYSNKRYNPYGEYIMNIDPINELKYHFASNDIDKILSGSNHELSTHTYSHYYCLEQGQQKEQFRSDLHQAIVTAKALKSIDLKTIVFPRNQFNKDYEEVLIEMGIIAYRGNEQTWFYKETSGKDDNLIRRVMRLIDTYFNISGHHCFDIKRSDNDQLINIPSSRFLRPYSSKLKFLEGLRLKRIKDSMTFAAKNGLIYHLWWHPHNFGDNMEKNIDFLNSILRHYSYLNKNYGFSSVTMKQLIDS